MLTTQDVKELRSSMGKAWESAYYESAIDSPHKPDLILADKAAFDLFVSWLYDNRVAIREYIMDKATEDTIAKLDNVLRKLS